MNGNDAYDSAGRMRGLIWRLGEHFSEVRAQVMMVRAEAKIRGRDRGVRFFACADMRDVASWRPDSGDVQLLVFPADVYD